jgi:hypothetical protein
MKRQRVPFGTSRTRHIFDGTLKLDQVEFIVLPTGIQRNLVLRGSDRQIVAALSIDSDQGIVIF